MLIAAHGLGKRYQTMRGLITAVDEVDLAVEAGEFVAICGRSGSGKSTLLALLGGLCRPTAGTVHVDGIDLGQLDRSALARFRADRVGLIFQFAGLLPHLRAVDNVALPALLAGRSDACDHAAELLAQVGLGARWDAYPRELSGGQQRRVALARALVNRPALLLADEPTNDLDEDAEREILNLLCRLQQAHATTLVVVTHDRAVANRAHRIVELRNGRIVSGARSVPAPPAGAALPSVALPPPSPTTPFEPEPATLASAPPTPVGQGLDRFLVAFLGWALLIGLGLSSVNRAAAWFQRRAIEVTVSRQKRARELALQQLRADISDVTMRPDGSAEVAVSLQNYDPQKPLYLLGPSLRAFVQVDQGWQSLPVRAGPSPGVRIVTDKELVSLGFPAQLERFDELIRGYLHVRITNAMVVSESPDATSDPFERLDDYYVYLKAPALSDDEVRRRNHWKPGALVPRWIAMPPH
jgi:putative ABC transport system ATP-binding protein/macrolide transport system ATP-binding/permease protein/lipoprotein-releasing system ATP-binding protein